MNETNLPTELVNEDANDRTLRTLVQGAVSVLLAAVLPLVYTAISAGVDNVDWSRLGFSAVTAGVMAVVAYVMGKVSPSTVLQKAYNTPTQ